MTNVDVIFLFITCITVAVNVSGDVCPANGNVVHMCQSNYEQTSSMYLDSSNSVGYDGSCTCFIQAINGSVTVMLSPQQVSSQCQVILDFLDFGLLLTCTETAPSPVNHTIEDGTRSYVSLSRANNETSADFCVRLQQTGGAGQLSLTCLQRDKNDLISKNVTESSPIATVIPQSVETISSPTNEGPGDQESTSQTVLLAPDANTVTLPAAVVTQPSDKVTEPYDKVTEPNATEASDKVTEPSNNVTEQSDKVTRSSDKVTEASNNVTEPSDKVTVPMDNVPEPSGNVTEPKNNVTMPPNSETTSPIHPASTSMNKVQLGGGINDSAVDTSTAIVPDTTAVTKDHTTNTGIISPVKNEGGVDSVQAFVAVGILGGTVPALLLLGVCVYLRDRRATRGRTHPSQEALEPETI